MGALFLVQPAVDSKTVQVLKKLLLAAQEGHVVGLAYIALHAGQDYSGDVVGHAAEHPLLVRGIVGALADEVAASLTRKP